MTSSPQASSTLCRRVSTRVPFAFAVAFTAMAMAVPQGQAADISWDGATGPFTTGTNWVGNVAPSTSDSGIIANGGTATITTGDTIAVSQIRVDNGVITQDAGSLSFSFVPSAPTPPATNDNVNRGFNVGTASGGTGAYTATGGTLSGTAVRIGMNGGTGTVTLSGSATYTGASNRDTWLGQGIGSTGTLNLTGNSQWNIAADAIVVGRQGGTGTLNLSNAAKLVGTTNDLYLGDGAGSNSTTTLSGTSQITWGNGVLRVGHGGGTSSVTLSDNAKITLTGQVLVGNQVGTNGTLTIGGSSEVSSNTWVAVGRDGGTGTLVIKDNGKFTKTGNDHFLIGSDAAGSTGFVTVQDNGSLSSSQRIEVGTNGGANHNGTLTVKNNATVTVANEFWVGNGGNQGTGTFNLQGGSITVNNWVAIGRDGTGTLNMSGGTFTKAGTNGNFIVNGQTGAGGAVNHTGGTINVANGQTWISEGGSRTNTWTASGGTANLGAGTFIGINGTGIMTIGGTANYTNAGVLLGQNGSGNGTLNLNGGTFTANSITKGAGAGVVNFDGGTLKAGADSATFVSGVTANVLAGGLTVDTNGFNDTITVNLSGLGGLTKTGAGALTLAGIQSYTGNTSILAGTLSIDSIYLADSSIVSIATGGVFDLATGGSDLIQYLIVNGVIQAAGTYGAIGSGAQYEVSYLTGDGFLVTAVPEPGHYALGIAALLGAMIVLRRRRALTHQA